MRCELVVLAGERERGAALARRIVALVPGVEAVAAVAGSLREAIAASRPAALVADVATGGGGVFAAFEALPEPRPPLLVCGPPDDAALVLRALRLGAREFVPQDADAAAFRAALERLLAREAPPVERGRGRAPVLAVLGAKGGVGNTFVASQLAVVLQALAGSTALFDLALPAGDAALHLDLQPHHWLAAAARDGAALDATLLRTLLTPHRSGVELLAAVEHAADGELLDAPTVERAVVLLRAEFEWVVLDLGRGWSEGTVRALDAADHVVLVTSADVPALVAARRQLELLGRLGVLAERIHVVENRHGRAEAIPERDLRRFLPRPVEAQLPEDAVVASCANEGRLLAEAAPHGHAHRAIVELGRCARTWCGQEDPPPARTGLLERVRLGLARRGYGTA
jgi:pilus assembly protein CpaE